MKEKYDINLERIDSLVKQMDLLVANLSLRSMNGEDINNLDDLERGFFTPFGVNDIDLERQALELYHAHGLKFGETYDYTLDLFEHERAHAREVFRQYRNKAVVAYGIVYEFEENKSVRSCGTLCYRAYKSVRNPKKDIKISLAPKNPSHRDIENANREREKLNKQKLIS